MDSSPRTSLSLSLPPFFSLLMPHPLINAHLLREDRHPHLTASSPSSILICDSKSSFIPPHFQPAHALRKANLSNNCFTRVCCWHLGLCFISFPWHFLFFFLHTLSFSWIVALTLSDRLCEFTTRLRLYTIMAIHSQLCASHPNPIRLG